MQTKHIFLREKSSILHLQLRAECYLFSQTTPALFLPLSRLPSLQLHWAVAKHVSGLMRDRTSSLSQPPWAKLQIITQPKCKTFKTRDSKGGVDAQIYSPVIKTMTKASLPWILPNLAWPWMSPGIRHAFALFRAESSISTQLDKVKLSVRANSTHPSYNSRLLMTKSGPENQEQHVKLF